MRIISLFSIYFLILMVLHGVIVGFADYKAYKKANALSSARKARVVGITIIILSVLLYIFKNIA